MRQLALSEKKSKQIRSEEQLVKLREKFVEQAKTYFGVPYARRYHEPGSMKYYIYIAIHLQLYPILLLGF